MCQYSCDQEAAPGVPNDWHLMHLGSFAAGGAALILTWVAQYERAVPRRTF
jgi:2,4-dienoyl-CoA reductase-like NADH-dependent reductase (Old Yellow Enzyme family)